MERAFTGLSSARCILGRGWGGDTGGATAAGTGLATEEKGDIIMCLWDHALLDHCHHTQISSEPVPGIWKECRVSLLICSPPLPQFPSSVFASVLWPFNTDILFIYLSARELCRRDWVIAELTFCASGCVAARL